MAKTDPERERRLAEALRANLRRRKAHARPEARDGTRAKPNLGPSLEREDQ